MFQRTFHSFEKSYRLLSANKKPILCVDTELCTTLLVSQVLPAIQAPANFCACHKLLVHVLVI